MQKNNMIHEWTMTLIIIGKQVLTAVFTGHVGARSSLNDDQHHLSSLSVDWQRKYIGNFNYGLSICRTEKPRKNRQISLVKGGERPISTIIKRRAQWNTINGWFH